MTGSCPFRTISVIGVGLMGASFAGALKTLPSPPVIRGSTPDQEEGEKAFERRLIDFYAPDNREIASGAELVVIAAPPSKIPEIWEEIRPVISPGTLLTDLASVKMNLHAIYIERYASVFPRYISSHPMAGRELTGVDASRPDLFRDRLTFLVPFSSSPREEDVDRLESLWRLAGSPRQTLVEPREHDRILSLISHLPHLLAFSLLETLVRTTDRKTLPHWNWPSQKGGALKDMLRTAWSSPDLWGDILLQNRNELLASIDDFTSSMELFKKILLDDSREEMIACLKTLQAKAREEEHRQPPRPEGRRLKGGSTSSG